MATLAEQARAEFEILSRDYAAGTSKLHDRGNFLPLDDMRAWFAKDFMGRLRVLFGPAKPGGYVLRHRATGILITAYSAQSGPSYGGGPRYPGELPPPGMPPGAEMFREQQARVARIEADPVLSKGLPVDWSQNHPDTLSLERLTELRQLEHAWRRRFCDVAAPPGFAEVVARLDELVSAVELDGGGAEGGATPRPSAPRRRKTSTRKG